MGDDIPVSEITGARITRAGKVLWSVRGVKGHKPGYLNYPDGLDLDVYRDWKNAPVAAR